MPAPAMIRALAAHGPMSVPDLARTLGMAPRGSHWKRALSLLRSNGLATVDWRGIIDLVEELRG
jgi:hypothetical protein